MVDAGYHTWLSVCVWTGGIFVSLCVRQAREGVGETVAQ